MWSLIDAYGSLQYAHLIQWNEYLLLTRPFLHCRLHPIYCTLTACGPDSDNGSSGGIGRHVRVIALHFVPIHTICTFICLFSAVWTENIPFIHAYCQDQATPHEHEYVGVRYHGPLFRVWGSSRWTRLDSVIEDPLEFERSTYVQLKGTISLARSKRNHLPNR